MPLPNLSEVREFKWSGHLPTEVDWTTKNKVNPIKDQKQCGSCWAFASTAVMESKHAIKTNNLVSLSE